MARSSGLSTIVIVLLGTCCFGCTKAQDGSSSSLQITLDFKAHEVDVSCAFNPDLAPSSDRLVSLTLSWRGQAVTSRFKDVAAVSVLGRGEVTVHDLGIQTTGEAHATATKSYLTATYMGYQLSNIGAFQCESTSINRFGHCIRERQVVDMSSSN